MGQEKKNILRNQKGVSTIELIPVLFLFVLLFNFSLGFFGVIHSGILNSIAARNYAFETFRNRANLNYLRDSPDGVGGIESYYEIEGFRFHGIVSDTGKNNGTDWIVTRRPIKFTDVKEGVANPQGSKPDHELIRTIADEGKASEVFDGKGPEEDRSGVSPIWIRTLYGICMNSACVKK